MHGSRQSSRLLAMRRRSYVNAATGWLLVLPCAAFIALFVYYPLFGTVFTSVAPTGAAADGPTFENYRFLLDDPVFRQVLVNNLIFAVATVPLSTGLALLMAVAVDQRISGRAAVRMAYFAPTVLPSIAVGNLWLFMSAPGFGLFNQMLGMIGLPEVNFLGQPGTALWTIIAMAVWKEASFFMVFFLAALQSIPRDLKDAAYIEGATHLQVFRKVVVPLLMPTIFFILVNALINAFRMVDFLFVTTKGGPNNSSSLLLYYIFENAIIFWDTAYAATLTIVLVLIIGIVTAAKFFYLDRKIHYQ